MAERDGKKRDKGNLLQRILDRFWLHIDDLAAKPCEPVLNGVSLVALSIYYVASIGLLWPNEGGGAFISTLLNAMCVLRGFCKVFREQKAYWLKVDNAWRKRTVAQKKFLEGVRRAFCPMFRLELVTLVGLMAMVLAAIFRPAMCDTWWVKVVGSAVLLVAFIGDGVDVLTDMYQAYMPLPAKPEDSGLGRKKK